MLFDCLCSPSPFLLSLPFSASPNLFSLPFSPFLLLRYDTLTTQGTVKPTHLRHIVVESFHVNTMKAITTVILANILRHCMKRTNELFSEEENGSSLFSSSRLRTHFVQFKFDEIKRKPAKVVQYIFNESNR